MKLRLKPFFLVSRGILLQALLISIIVAFVKVENMGVFLLCLWPFFMLLFWGVSLLVYYLIADFGKKLIIQNDSFVYNGKTIRLENINSVTVYGAARTAQIAWLPFSFFSLFKIKVSNMDDILISNLVIPENDLIMGLRLNKVERKNTLLPFIEKLSFDPVR